jgi:hypothetical protein
MDRTLSSLLILHCSDGVGVQGSGADDAFDAFAPCFGLGSGLRKASPDGWCGVLDADAAIRIL